MKKVHTPENVAHLFANQLQDEARTQTNNFHFHHNMIFSYGSHFCIARHNGGFNVDIIYYYHAMEYLRNIDNSLRESLEIAKEYGYKLEDINSELLASLHASKKVMCDYWDYQNEINNFFNTL